MTAPDPQHIDAIAMVRAIGQQHRPVSVSVVRNSVTCACGHESTNHDGLEEHRATLIVEWLMSQRAAMLDALTRHGVLTRQVFGPTFGGGYSVHYRTESEAITSDEALAILRERLTGEVAR